MHHRYLVGDTIRISWINSGVIPDSIFTAITNESSMLVSSGPMISSGDGHYYYPFFIPDSGPQFFSALTTSVINSYTYRRCIRFQTLEHGVQ